jgi:hypothetical protein
MLQEYARLARPYFVLLAIFTIGRWLMGLFAVPYEKGTHVLSIVTLTYFAAVFSAAYTRRWLGYRLTQAAGLAMLMAASAQVVILLSTLASYLLGIHSYFNEPIAVHNRPDPIGLWPAIGVRVMGLVFNTLLTGILGAVGWALGGLLPARER